MLQLAGLGLVVGVGVLLAAGKMLSGLLFGVRLADPLTIAGVTRVSRSSRSLRHGFPPLAPAVSIL